MQRPSDDARDPWSDNVSSRWADYRLSASPSRQIFVVSSLELATPKATPVESHPQAYSRKIVPICFLFQRRIRWRRAFFQLGREKIKSWEGLRGGIRRTRSNSPVSNRDFLVPTGFTSSLLPLDRQ